MPWGEFPGGGSGGKAGAGSGTISSITSTGGTVAITSPGGPTTNIDVSSRTIPPLIPTAKAANYPAVSGDYVEMTGAFTVTLPAPTANRIVAVTSVNGTGAAPCTVSSVTNGGNILGPGVAAAAQTILLGAAGSYVILVADGTNWNIVSGQQDTGWIVVGSGGSAAPFTNSWANFGSGNATAAYRLQGNIVRLRGGIQSGASGTSPFTLPTGFRPLAQIGFSPLVYTGSTSTNSAVIVPTTGVIVDIYGASTQVAFLDGITFTVD